MAFIPPPAAGTSAAASERRHRHLLTLGLNSDEIEESISLGHQRGHFMTSLKERGLPELKVFGDEVVIDHHCGSFIRLSRDNLGHAAHGKGGTGGTDCASIYLCAGLLSGAGDRRKKSRKEVIQTGPNTALDAATLYLTQRGAVDEYFALPKGKHRNTDNFSGAVLKSDHTRIIGRESIKIYAGKGYYQGTGFYGEPNSQSGDILHQGSIDLIVGGSDDLQPVVKGDNLRECLIEMYKMIESICSCQTLHHKTMSFLAASLFQIPAPQIQIPALNVSISEYMQSIESTLKVYRSNFMEMNYLGLGFKDEEIIAGGYDIITGDISYILSHHVSTT